MAKVRTIVVGTGGMARHHLRRMLKQTRTTAITGLVDVSEEQRELTRAVFAEQKAACPPFYGTIRELLRPAVLIPESKKLNVLLREFRQSRNHMAIVVNEYGGVAGLITIEDVLEQIVGDIEDEYDFDEEQDNILEVNEANAGLRWRVKALTELEQFNEVLGATLSSEDVDTIGGLVANHLGRMPRKGEIFEIDQLRFEVLRADARQLHVLLVEKIPERSFGESA